MPVGERPLAATLLLLALRGLRRPAAAAAPVPSPLEEAGQVLIVGTRTFGLACPGLEQGSDATAALGPQAQVAVASYGEPLCALSPEGGEVIWKGESAPAWIHAAAALPRQ